MTAHEALHSSLSSEWYTPPEIIALVKKVFNGVIDLDPASCEVGNRVVGARRYFTREEDGLKQRWEGNVFLNSPYSSDGGAETWVSKTVTERAYFDGGIVLLNATTDRKWFAPLWNETICFLDKRIRFLEEPAQREARWKKRHPNEPCPAYKGEVVEGLLRGPQPTHGNVLVYFGKLPKKFADVLRPHGRIVVPRRWAQFDFADHVVL